MIDKVFLRHAGRNIAKIFIYLLFFSLYVVGSVALIGLVIIIFGDMIGTIYLGFHLVITLILIYTYVEWKIGSYD